MPGPLYASPPPFMWHKVEAHTAHYSAHPLFVPPVAPVLVPPRNPFEPPPDPEVPAPQDAPQDPSAAESGG